VFGNKTVEHSVAKELKPLVRAPGFVNILKVRAMEKRFEEKMPVRRPITDGGLKSDKIEPFPLEGCNQSFNIGLTANGITVKGD
jgi:hypothetical protein